MQTLKMTITIESDEETETVTQTVQIARPATQEEVDTEIEKVYERYEGQTVTVNWNEEKLVIE